MTVETFLDNFGHLADAPNGVKKLRGLILQLAVQGKLVPQDPEDEPASVLLGRIEVIKEKLIKEGRIKSPKSFPLVSKKEIHFELPKTWELCRFGDLGLIGSSSRVHKKDWKNKGVPFLRAREIVKLSQFGTVDNELYISEELFQELSIGGLVPEQNDLMITGVGTIGIPYIVKKSDRFYFKDASVLIFKNVYDLYPQFLNCLMRTPYWIDRIHKESMGTTVHTLTISRANEIPFPLPPLAEQKRIVAKVDQLMDLCDELEARQKKQQQGRVRLNNAALDKLLIAREPNEFADHWQRISTNFDLLYDHPETIGKLRAAILQLAVQGKLVPQDPYDEPASVLLGRIRAEKERLIDEGVFKTSKKEVQVSPEEMPFAVPSNWAWTSLSGLTEVITKGSSPKWQGVQYVDADRGVLFITSENVGSFGLRLDKKKYVERKFNEIEPRSILRNGDILMNIVGASIGRTAVYDIEDIANINQAVCLIRFVGQGTLTYLRYFLTFFNTSTCISYMFEKQVDSARANLSMGNIAKFAIPLPPLEEQKRIVAKVDQLMTLCDELEIKLNQAQQRSEKLMEATVQQLLVA